MRFLVRVPNWPDDEIYEFFRKTFLYAKFYESHKTTNLQQESCMLYKTKNASAEVHFDQRYFPWNCLSNIQYVTYCFDPIFTWGQSWSASRRTLLGGEDHKVVTSPTIYMIRPVGMSPTSNLNSVIFMINGSQSNDNPKTFLIAIFIASIIFSLSTGIFFFDWILIFSNHLIYLLELKNLWDRVPIKVHLRDMLHMYHFNVKMMGSKLDHM